MRIIIIILTLLAFSDSAFAQQVADRFVDAALRGCVRFSYSFRTETGTKITGTGSAVVQGSSYKVIGNGLEIYCDGSSCTTVDTNAKEIVIESISDRDGVSQAAVPALLIGDFKSYFKPVSEKSVTIAGKNCIRVDMKSLQPALGISSVSVDFHENGNSAPTIVHASVKTTDAMVTDFTITSMSFSQKLPQKEFFFDQGNLDSTWVITDLR